MSLPAWPDGVNSTPQRGSWSVVKPFLDPLATDMNQGNQRQRSEPGNNVAIIAQTLRMSEAESAIFETFFRTTLSNGTSRFTMTVWTGSAYVSKTVQFVVGQLTCGRPGQKVEWTMQLRIYGM